MNREMNKFKNKKTDKTRLGNELVEKKKRAKEKGSVTYHIDSDGIVVQIEHKEFF